MRWISFVLFMMACADPQAEDQSQNEISVPEARPEELTLVSAGMDTTYSGSTIIWQALPPAEGVAEVAKVSLAILNNGVRQLQYIDNVISPDIDQVGALKSEAEALGKDIFIKDFSGLLQRSALWIGGEDGRSGWIGQVDASLKAANVEPLEPGDFMQAQRQFALYCQAKLWDRTFQKTLINEEYRAVRPTPMAFCEGVYQQLGLLVRTSEKCRATQDQYQNFFGCLWHEGVTKSPLWRTRYPEGGDVHQTFALYNDTELRELFFTHRIGPKLLQQKGTLILPAVGSQPMRRVDLGYTTTAVGLGSASVADILSHIERRPIDEDSFRFISQERFSPAARAIVKTHEDELRGHLKFLGLLSNGFYVNENQYNQPFQKKSDVQESILWSERVKKDFENRFSQILLTTDEVLLTLKKDFVQKKAKLMTKLSDFQRNMRELDTAQSCDGETRLACDYLELSQRAKDVVRPVAISKAVWQSQLRVQGEAERVWLELKLNKVSGQTWRACAGQDCPSDVSKASYTPETGRISATFALENHGQGLDRSPRSAFDKNLSFSDLPIATIKQLRLDGHLGNVGSVLNVFIGDLVLEGKSETWRGAIKYRDENPPQMVKVKRFLSEIRSLTP